MLRHLRTFRSCKTIVVYRMPDGSRVWQSLIAEPDQIETLDEVTEAIQRKNGDPSDVVRRVTRPVALEEISRQAEFQSFGAFDASSRTASTEHVIAAEGQYPNGVLLLRAGFARVSHSINDRDRTIRYLGPGQPYGLREIAHNWRDPERPVPLLRTLRAVGYVDVILIPTAAVETHVLPSIPAADLPAPVLPQDERREPLAVLREEAALDPGMIEFVVDHRFTNGTAAMVIDLERCTRCDDCVRACAAAHDNNPRFVRHGPTHGRFMIANACMHCADPVCMIGCPTGAITRESAGGQVVINDRTCIGCASCANQCPYQNIRMVEIRSEDGRVYIDARNQAHRKATKCDLCIDQMGGPACQRACPHDALRRIDLTRADDLARWLAR